MTFPPANPYRYRQGLYWFEFIQLIQRNATSSSLLQFYPPSNLQKEIITICDSSLPKRYKDEIAETGSKYDTDMVNSIVVNASYLDGEIPMRNIAYTKQWNPVEERWEFKSRPVRGVINVLKILEKGGCINMSDEVKQVMECGDD